MKSVGIINIKDLMKSSKKVRKFEKYINEYYMLVSDEKNINENI